MTWHVAIRPGKRRLRDKNKPIDALMNQIKADVRCRVEHPFRVIRCWFVHARVRYRWLKKDTAQLIMLFALFAPVDGAGQTEGSGGVNVSDNMASALQKAKKASVGDGTEGIFRDCA